MFRHEGHRHGRISRRPCPDRRPIAWSRGAAAHHLHPSPAEGQRAPPVAGRRADDDDKHKQGGHNHQDARLGEGRARPGSQHLALTPPDVLLGGASPPGRRGWPVHKIFRVKLERLGEAQVETGKRCAGHPVAQGGHPDLDELPPLGVPVPLAAVFVTAVACAWAVATTKAGRQQAGRLPHTVLLSSPRPDARVTTPDTSPRRRRARMRAGFTADGWHCAARGGEEELTTSAVSAATPSPGRPDDQSAAAQSHAHGASGPEASGNCMVWPRARDQGQGCDTSLPCSAGLPWRGCGVNRPGGLGGRCSWGGAQLDARASGRRDDASEHEVPTWTLW